MSAFGQSGMSTPLSDISMPNIPTSRCPNQKASMNSGRGLYYYRGILSQDAEDALHAAAEGRLRRPLKVFVAPTKTVRAASGPQGGLRKLHRSLLLKRLPVQQVCLLPRHRMQRVEIVHSQHPPMLQLHQ
ncbi:TPA: hypothetical protein ACH3X1_003579 [Trebouxia sp. C0004]